MSYLYYVFVKMCSSEHSYKYSFKRSSKQAFKQPSRHLNLSVSIKCAAVILLLSSTSMVYGFDECGVIGSNTTSMTCSDASYNSGIYYRPTEGFTLRVDNPNVTVNGEISLVYLDPNNPADMHLVMDNFDQLSASSNTSSGAFRAHTRNSSGDATVTIGSAGNIQHTVSVTGRSGASVEARSGGRSDADINFAQARLSSDAVLGSANSSLRAIAHGDGNASISMTSGTITNLAQQQSSYGLDAQVYNDSGNNKASIHVSDGEISTISEIGTGINIFSRGLSEVIFDGGSISTSGNNFASGIYTYSDKASASDTDFTNEIIIRGGSISTQGSSSWGVGAESVRGIARVELSGGAISTQGDNAQGVYVYNNPAAQPFNANTLFEMSGGQITTSGNAAHGIYNLNLGSGEALVNISGGQISSQNADGISVEALNGRYQINISGGTVNSGAGESAAVRASAANGGSITIGTDAIINGTSSGIAIRDGDPNRNQLSWPASGASADGIDELGGNSVITSMGTIMGNTILGAGDDTFNLAGGSYSGDIYADDANANSTALGNDSFNWSGGNFNSQFHGGNGSDTATINAQAGYNGTQVLDGGDDANQSDGWIDRLNFNGVRATINANTLRNWEQIQASNSHLTLPESTLTTGTLSLDNQSSLNTTGNLNLAGNLSNQGEINLQNNRTGDRLIVSGDYIGGGRLLVDLDPASNASDTLSVNGSINGTTELELRSVGTEGQLGSSMTLIESNNLSASSFTLASDTLNTGPYQYRYQLNTIQNQLNASITQKTLSPLGQSYHTAAESLMHGLTHLDSLEARGRGKSELAKQGGISTWLRANTKRYSSGFKQGARNDNDYQSLDLGVELANAHGYSFGLAFSELSLDADSDSSDATKLSSDGYGLMLSAQWLGEHGWYTDAQINLKQIEFTLASENLDALVKDQRINSHAASLELGKSIALSNKHEIIPLAQFSYARLDHSRFEDGQGNAISLQDSRKLIRLGLGHAYYERSPYSPAKARLYTALHLDYDLDDEQELSVANAKVYGERNQLNAELIVKGEAFINAEASIAVEGQYQRALNQASHNGLGLSLGFNQRF